MTCRRPASLAAWPLIAAVLIGGSTPQPLPACCAVAREGQHVINSDQAVIIVWDAALKMQHLIRRASFRGGGTDLGFIIPSPTQPDLQEAKDEAFYVLDRLTEPQDNTTDLGFWARKEIQENAQPPSVRVVEQKQVAGFDAAVLEADSADALVQWLEKHDYSYSPAVRDWAKPYVEAKWKFTALKISKPDEHGHADSVAAKPLRMSFKTDRPLFPYREPATGVPEGDRTAQSRSKKQTQPAHARRLTIYFLSDARYVGQLDGTYPGTTDREEQWGGTVAYAKVIQPNDHRSIVEALGLPQLNGQAIRWLTKFEDKWPYRLHHADLVFTKSDDTTSVEPTSHDGLGSIMKLIIDKFKGTSPALLE